MASRIASSIALFFFISSLLIGEENSLVGAKEFEFALRQYRDYQISSGKGGQCKENAEKVFVQPFKGKNLTDISKDGLANLRIMAQEVVKKEDLFNAALKKANGNKTLIAQLQAGKIANKCLKLIGTKQALEAQSAKGKKIANVRFKLEDIEKKLSKNIEIDAKNNRKPMMSFLDVGKK